MKRYAFLMASDGSPHTTKLKYATSDAVRLADALRSPRLSYDVVGPVTAVDAFHLQKQLYAAVASCEDDDTFICYFGGHGVLHNGELYLVWDNTTRQYFATALKCEIVLDAMRNCTAKNKLLILNCCHAGGALGAMSATGTPVSELRLETSNSCVLMAGDRLDLAYEFDDLGGSFLTTAICSAFGDNFDTADANRDKRLSLHELMNWLRAESLSYNKSHKLREPLPTPVLLGKERGEEFILTAERGAWQPLEIALPDGSSIVVLPIAPSYNDMAVGISKFPVTNAQYQRFVSATGRKTPEGIMASSDGVRGGRPTVLRPWEHPAFAAPEQPVVCVSYADAADYCQWAQESSPGMLLDLPTPRLWNFAATGDTFLDPRFAKRLASRNQTIHHNAMFPAPHDATGARTNALGVADMFGNVWQWCGAMTRSEFPHRIPTRDVRLFARIMDRIVRLRGGGYLNNITLSALTSRADDLIDGVMTRRSDIGFRIAAQIELRDLPEQIRLALQLSDHIDWARQSRFGFGSESGAFDDDD